MRKQKKAEIKLNTKQDLPEKQAAKTMSKEEYYKLNKSIYEDMRYFELEAAEKEQNSLVEASKTLIR